MSVEKLDLFQSRFVCFDRWLHLIGVTFDIEVDGELQSDAFLHRLLQSRDLLSSKLVPDDERHKCFVTLRPIYTPFSIRSKCYQHHLHLFSVRMSVYTTHPREDSIERQTVGINFNPLFMAIAPSGSCGKAPAL